jgi:hypothetical protein
MYWLVLKPIKRKPSEFQCQTTQSWRHSRRPNHDGVLIASDVEEIPQPQFRSTKFVRFNLICLNVLTYERPVDRAVYKANNQASSQRGQTSYIIRRPVFCARPLHSERQDFPPRERVSYITYWTATPTAIRLHPSPTPHALGGHIFITPLFQTVHNLLFLFNHEPNKITYLYTRLRPMILAAVRDLGL